MKIERNYDTTVATYNVTADGDDGLEKMLNIDQAIVVALVRLGMKAQQERDAGFLEGYDNPACRSMNPEAAANAIADAKAIRNMPVENRHAENAIRALKRGKEK